MLKLRYKYLNNWNFGTKVNQSVQSINNPDGSSTSIEITRVDGAKAVTVVFPAMGVFARYYRPLAATLASRKINAVLVDLRGNDTSSERPQNGADFGYKEQIEFDFHSVITFVRHEFASIPLFLFGHSLGGQLSCLYASKYPSAIDGIILSATCSVYYKGWNGLSAYRILAGTQFARLVATMLGYFPGKKIGFGGMEAKTVIRDWSRQSRTGRYELANDTFDFESALAQLDKPILSISYEGDDLAPLGAVDHLLSKLRSSEVTRVHLKKSDPRNADYDHFNWAKKPEKLVNIVDHWMNSRYRK